MPARTASARYSPGAVETNAAKGAPPSAPPSSAKRMSARRDSAPTRSKTVRMYFAGSSTLQRMRPVATTLCLPRVRNSRGAGTSAKSRRSTRVTVWKGAGIGTDGRSSRARTGVQGGDAASTLRRKAIASLLGAWLLLGTEICGPAGPYVISASRTGASGRLPGAGRAFEATENEERAGGSDMSTTLTARPVSSVDIDTRVEAVDWASVSTHLDGYGWAMLRKLLTADECQTIARLYEDDRQFRSHVVMARHG